MSSGGFAAALKVLAPRYEAASGDKLILEWGPSMGDTANAVPQRLARNEDIDVVIMVGYALDKLVADGKALGDSKTALAQSGIGVVVKKGAPLPDIHSTDALRDALLAAKSVAYSDSASGVYIRDDMFAKLGVKDAMSGKAKMIPAVPVASVVASGDYEIGFQQISELKPIPGVTLVGPLPAGLQKMTVFSGGIVSGTHHEASARALLKFLQSADSAETIRESGMEPLAAAAK